MNNPTFLMINFFFIFEWQQFKTVVSTPAFGF